jgi:diacylglycerol kinase family enzyme
MADTIATAETPPPAGRPRLRRLAAVVNSASGGVGPGAAAALASLVSEQGLELTLAEPAPNGIDAAVRAAVEAAPDLLIVLAGDGTARRAAELSGPDGPPIAPLAGGTMNVLPHALYGPQPWAAALAEILESGVERTISGGRLDGHAFYVAAILGAPALWGSVREAMRAGRFGKAGRGVRYALARAFSGDLHYVLDGKPSRQTEALVLITPTVSTAMPGEAAALEAASLDIRRADQVVGLAFHGLTGDWRRDSRVSVESCERGRARARRPIPCILDGEIQSVGREIEFSFEPRAFRALVPAAGGAA